MGSVQFISDTNNLVQQLHDLLLQLDFVTFFEAELVKHDSAIAVQNQQKGVAVEPQDTFFVSSIVVRQLRVGQPVLLEKLESSGHIRIGIDGDDRKPLFTVLIPERLETW